MAGMMGRQEYSSNADAYFKWYAFNSWANRLLAETPDNGASFFEPSTNMMYLINPVIGSDGMNEYINNLYLHSFKEVGGSFHLSSINAIFGHIQNSSPADLSGKNYQSVLVNALFSAKRGQSLEEIIDLNSLGKNFNTGAYSSWSETGYIQKQLKSAIVSRIYPSSSNSAFRDLQIITSKSTSSAYRGMDLAQIPNINSTGFTSYKNFPYKLSARFYVYDRSGDNPSLLNLVNVSFYNYQTLMAYLNVGFADFLGSILHGVDNVPITLIKCDQNARKSA